MKTDVFRQVTHARIAFTLTITCGILMTIVMIAEMTFLSSIINRVFIFHAGLDTLGPLLALLGGAILLRAVFVWAREVSAQEGAIRVKAELRRRLFAHLLQLGPAYSKGESTACSRFSPASAARWCSPSCLVASWLPVICSC